MVILDLAISGSMGGKDAVKEILKIDPSANIVVSSGYSNDPVMSNYKDYGFKALISKPFQLIELNKILNISLN